MVKYFQERHPRDFCKIIGRGAKINQFYKIKYVHILFEHKGKIGLAPLDMELMNIGLIIGPLYLKTFLLLPCAGQVANHWCENGAKQS